MVQRLKEVFNYYLLLFMLNSNGMRTETRICWDFAVIVGEKAALKNLGDGLP